ncbi:MAG TPA: hypothetical protein VK133_03740 [Amoebophilaceae bacterium]|nr:hypothetical protein [Amoebophilaceae bacterium]
MKLLYYLERCCNICIATAFDLFGTFFLLFKLLPKMDTRINDNFQVLKSASSFWVLLDRNQDTGSHLVRTALAPFEKRSA